MYPTCIHTDLADRATRHVAIGRMNGMQTMQPDNDEDEKKVNRN